MKSEIIYVDFRAKKEVSEQEAFRSFTFNRAVEFLSTLGVDHPESRNALSFLSEADQIAALEAAEDTLSPEAS